MCGGTCVEEDAGGRGEGGGGGGGDGRPTATRAQSAPGGGGRRPPPRAPSYPPVFPYRTGGGCPLRGVKCPHPGGTPEGPRRDPGGTPEGPRRGPRRTPEDTAEGGAHACPLPPLGAHAWPYVKCFAQPLNTDTPPPFLREPLCPHVPPPISCPCPCLLPAAVHVESVQRDGGGGGKARPKQNAAWVGDRAHAFDPIPPSRRRRQRRWHASAFSIHYSRRNFRRRGHVLGGH
jgi:hypothetical protein